MGIFDNNIEQSLVEEISKILDVKDLGFTNYKYRIQLKGDQLRLIGASAKTMIGLPVCIEKLREFMPVSQIIQPRGGLNIIGNPFNAVLSKDEWRGHGETLRAKAVRFENVAVSNALICADHVVLDHAPVKGCRIHAKTLDIETNSLYKLEDEISGEVDILYLRDSSDDVWTYRLMGFEFLKTLHVNEAVIIKTNNNFCDAHFRVDSDFKTCLKYPPVEPWSYSLCTDFGISDDPVSDIRKLDAYDGWAARRYPAVNNIPNTFYDPYWRLR